MRRNDYGCVSVRAGGPTESHREKERESASRLGRDCVTTLAPYRGGFCLTTDYRGMGIYLLVPSHPPTLSPSPLPMFTTSLYRPRSLRQPLHSVNCLVATDISLPLNLRIPRSVSLGNKPETALLRVHTFSQI